MPDTRPALAARSIPRPALLCWAALPVLGRVAGDAMLSGAPGASPATQQFAYAAAVTVCALLLAGPTERLSGAAQWCAGAALAGLLAMFSPLAVPAPVPTGSPATALKLALALALVLALLLAARALLTRLTGDARAAHYLVVLLLAVTVAAPVWLGPLAATTDSTALANAALLLSPPSLLASAAGLDLMRQAWFYEHTPLGGLRYAYPPFALAALGYLALATLLALLPRATARGALRFNL